MQVSTYICVNYMHIYVSTSFASLNLHSLMRRDVGNSSSFLRGSTSSFTFKESLNLIFPKIWCCFNLILYFSIRSQVNQRRCCSYLTATNVLFSYFKFYFSLYLITPPFYLIICILFC